MIRELMRVCGLHTNKLDSHYGPPRAIIRYSNGLDIHVHMHIHVAYVHLTTRGRTIAREGSDQVELLLVEL